MNVVEFTFPEESPQVYENFKEYIEKGYPMVEALKVMMNIPVCRV